LAGRIKRSSGTAGGPYELILTTAVELAGAAVAGLRKVSPGAFVVVHGMQPSLEIQPHLGLNAIPGVPGVWQPSAQLNSEIFFTVAPDAASHSV